MVSLAAGCTTGGRKAPKVGVILPDITSSVRWETQDRKYLERSFKDAGISYEIRNANGDKVLFQTIADQLLNDNVTVLLIVDLDSASGTAVIKKALARGVKVIDYDRLTLGGGASYYVSFDGVAVGRLQGEGLVKCLAAAGVKKPVIAELNGSPTDNNATLFKQGYDSVLDPRYKSEEFVKGPDQSVPGWSEDSAGGIFQQMMGSGRAIDGVLAANDGLGNAAIKVLKTKGRNGKVPVTGQDATIQGLQNILVGDQCMTVYKAIELEATAGALLAVALATEQIIHLGQSIRDPVSGVDVPSRLLPPQSITKANMKIVLDDGFVTRAQLCTATYEAACRAAGI
jgi:D-xylose transport system substrate-binding protein